MYKQEIIFYREKAFVIFFQRLGRSLASELRSEREEPT